MPKIQKSLLPQNLAQYRVWVYDTEPSSRYFKLSQVPEILPGGKTAFLINGSPELVKSTDVLVEIIDSAGNPIFQQPIKNYVEGLARLISIEVYENTPPGLATVTILGQLTRDKDGNLPPDEFKNSYNVMWQTQVNVSPSKPNDGIIRLAQKPQLYVEEFLLPYRTAATGSVASSSIGRVYTTGFNQNYLLVSGFTMSREMNSATFMVSQSQYQFTSSIGTVLSNTQAILSSSLYDIGGKPVAIDSTNFKIEYLNPTVFVPTLLTRSFADIYITNLTTLSGDIQRARVYVRSVDQPGNYQQIADVALETTELTVTQSFDTNDYTLKLGYFIDQTTIEKYWDSGEITPQFQYVSGGVDVLYNSTELLDAAYIASPTNLFNTGSTAPRNYFGLRQPLEFTEGLEYTLSGSFACVKGNSAMTARMDVYLMGESFPSSSNDLLGIKIASYTVPPGSIGRRFENVSENFTALRDGNANLRFVIYGGTWYIANIGVFSARETGFNPDEIRVTAPIIGMRRYEELVFRVELLDLNSNIVPVNIESNQMQFDGGNVVFKGYDHRMEGMLSVAPSGSSPSGTIRLNTQGFVDPNNITFYSGSAIYVGEGTVFNKNTPFLFAADTGGLPWVSISDRLIGYVDTGSGEFILKIRGTILVGSGSNYVDISTLLPRAPSVRFLDRTTGTSADFYELRGTNSVSAGRWFDQISRMGNYTRGTDGFNRQPPLVLPGFTGSLDPYNNGLPMSSSFLTSGTISVPPEMIIWNEFLYASMSIKIEQIAQSLAPSFQLTYKIEAGTSWNSYAEALSQLQSVYFEDSLYVTELRNVSPEPNTILDYPILLPRVRTGDTLYVVTQLKIITYPNVNLT